MSIKSSLLFAGAVIFILGLLLLYSLMIQNLGLVLFGASTTGIIERIESKGIAAERPLVHFTSASGSEIHFRGFDVARGYYKTNQAVQLRYFPSNPQNAEIDSWLSLWRPLGIGLSFTSCLLLAGIFLLCKGLRLPQKDRKPLQEKPRGKNAPQFYIIGAVWLAITITGITFLSMQEDGTDRIDQALIDGRELFASLSLPEGARPYADMTEKVYSGKTLTSVTVKQVFAVPGRFPEVVAFYEQVLPQQGWVASHKENRKHYASYHMPSWEVEITRDAYSYENPSRPHHRFALTLTWRFN